MKSECVPVMAQWVENSPATQETHEMEVLSLDREDRSEEEMLQYACLKNPIGRGAWQAVVQRVAKSWTRLSDWTCMHNFSNFKIRTDINTLSPYSILPY